MNVGGDHPIMWVDGNDEIAERRRTWWYIGFVALRLTDFARAARAETVAVGKNDLATQRMGPGAIMHFF